MMDGSIARLTAQESAPPIEVRYPARQTAPLVLASPHSGSRYPQELMNQTRLGLLALRRSEDCFVHEIFSSAPRLGAPLLHALFPRVYLDANREPFEFDPDMFSDDLPETANIRSARVAAGLGTIPRIVTSGEEIYCEKLTVGEALRRVDLMYRPYHRSLMQLVRGTREQFGIAALIDCHSMPSQSGGACESRQAADFVLGDNHGEACDSRLVEAAEEVLGGLGYRVVRNNPYSGGYTTQHYGRPDKGVHVLQIEINRAIYMDEARVERGPYLPVLARHVEDLIAALAEATLELTG
jgi:N-formylglutamate amidohydrolase